MPETSKSILTIYTTLTNSMLNNQVIFIVNNFFPLGSLGKIESS